MLLYAIGCFCHHFKYTHWKQMALQWRHNERDCVSNDQRKQQSSTQLAFVRGIHRWLLNAPYKRPVTSKMFRFHDVIMEIVQTERYTQEYSYKLQHVISALCVWLYSSTQVEKYRKKAQFLYRSKYHVLPLFMFLYIDVFSTFCPVNYTTHHKSDFAIVSKHEFLTWPGAFHIIWSKTWSTHISYFSSTLANILFLYAWC